jgi:hypothetical protein
MVNLKILIAIYYIRLLVKKMIYYIYKITNVLNNHYYYGRRAFDGKDPEQDLYFGSGKRLKAAIKKYGKQNFNKKIISIHSTEKELILEEQKIITEDVVKDPACYNLALGGHGGYTYYLERVFYHSEESKQKISQANRGRPRPDARETFIKLGINKWWKGKTRSKEDRAAKSIAAKNAIISGKHPAKLMATCPYCNYTTTIGNAKRWHFDNCKKK